MAIHTTLAAQLVPHLAGPVQAPPDRRISVLPADVGQHLGVAHRPGRGRPRPGRVVGVRAILTQCSASSSRPTKRSTSPRVQRQPKLLLAGLRNQPLGPARAAHSGTSSVQAHHT